MFFKEGSKGAAKDRESTNEETSPSTDATLAVVLVSSATELRQRLVRCVDNLGEGKKRERARNEAFGAPRFGAPTICALISIFLQC